MAFNPTADAILFGIQSAIKLGGAVQQAYANNLRARELVFPLPKFKTGVTTYTVRAFFNENGDGYKFLQDYPELKLLHEKGSDRSEAEDNDYTKFYQILSHADEDGWSAESNGDVVTNRETCVTFFRIRQWEKGQEPDQLSALQLVGGALIEVGIDYFSQSQKPFFKDNPFGRSLSAFLAGLDDLTFSSPDDFKHLSRKLVPQLFIAASEVLQELSDDITGDEKFQALIRHAGTTLAADIMKRLKTIEDEPDDSLAFDEDGVLQWGQFVFRSIVRNTGNHFLANLPVWMSGKKGGVALVQSTGKVLLDAILDNPVDRIDLKKVFTTETLDAVMQASFRVFAEHPEMISRKAGVQDIVTGVSLAVLPKNPGDKIELDLLIPELVRLILENTAGQLDQLWDANTENGEHLLLITVRELLKSISQPAPNGRWKPRFSHSQLLGLAENLISDVADDPAWILNKAGDKALLGAVLEAVFDALRQLPDDQRIAFHTVEMLLEVSMRTAATHKNLLGKVKFAGTDQQQEDLKSILNHALDIVFGYMFRRAELPPVRRFELLEELLEFVLEMLLEMASAKYPDAKSLALLKLVLVESGIFEQDGRFDVHLARRMKTALLQVLNQHPELVSDKPVVQDLIRRTAVILKKNNRAELLPDMLPLLLDLATRALRERINPNDDTPVSQLLDALEAALPELVRAVPDPAGDRWRLELNRAQLHELMLFLLELVLEQQPAWAKDKETLQAVIKSVLDALRTAPAGARIDFPALLQIIQATLLAAWMKSDWVKDRIEDLNALQYALEQLVDVLFEEELGSIAGWKLTESDTLNLLIEAYLKGLARQNLNKTNVKKALAILKKAVDTLNKLEDFDLTDLLLALEQGKTT